MVDQARSPISMIRGVVVLALVVVLFCCGCDGPEAGRARGGGHGADGGNYSEGKIHAPSKIDGTKIWTALPKT